MALRTATIEVDADLAGAYRKASQSRRMQAIRAFRRVLLSPRGAAQTACLSPEETALLLKINRNLSEEQQVRYDSLTQKRLAGSLASGERRELETLVEIIEEIWIDRLEAVAELARIRGISSEELMEQLELDSGAGRPGR